MRTYAFDNTGYVSGIGISSADLVGSLWTPDNSWTALDTSIAAFGLVEGLYTITDALSSESLTIAINRSVAVPAPQALMLLGLGLAALGLGRRRRNA